jgi:uncharacterized protein YecE (DUF72 family)
VGELFIGLSGYSYKPWQGEGRFYPVGLKASAFLGYYTGRYPAVEMDGSWYKTPTEAAIALWREGTPENFKFSFKLHRRITHIVRLKPDCFEELKFICKRVAPLASVEKLGPFLIQLPPNLKKDEARLEAFVAALPASFHEVEGYSGPPGQPARWSLEFRHESWNCDSVAEILRAKNVAWVASDRDEERAVRRDTADFHYVRLRRMDTDEEALNGWSSYFQAALARGQDCYVYCKHEDEGSPWIWADYLLARARA